MVAELATSSSRWAPHPQLGALAIALAAAVGQPGQAIHGNQLTKQLDEVYVTKQLDGDYVTTGVQDEAYVTTRAHDEVYVNTREQDEVYVTTKEQDEIYVTTNVQDEVYVTMTTAQALNILEAAEQRGYPDISIAETLHRLGAEGASATKKLIFVLVMTVKGSAQMPIRSVEDQNGALAWRALIKRYEPATAMRVRGITTAIINVKPFPSDLAGFEQHRADWVRDIRRYETAPGEVFNAGTEKSIYPQKAPKNIRAALQMQSERSYDELISTTMQHLQAATVHEDGRQQKWPSPPGPGAAGG
ncbi:unnamed protein product [Prorocentrum cordatum]|uniref:Uncharacterized protein n=1 Tax=Prorocentrum cordatum TaxID=2364126 RepID=A0ABN9QTN4_9DINO|nr:unnamed protein product [Polarella glacialis]